MEFTVSAKDKKLLYVVFVFAFAILYLRFLFVPGMSALKTARADLAEAENARAEMQQTLLLAPGYAANKEAALSGLQQASTAYYPLLSSGELDTLVTGLELSHDLEPLTLTIGTPAVQALPGYTAGSLPGYTAGSLAGHSAVFNPVDTVQPGDNLLLSGFAADTSAVTEAAAGYFRTVSVQLTCSGKNEDFLSLLDDLAADYPTIHIDSFSISDRPYANADGEAVESSSFSVSLSIFLCDKGGIQP